MALPNSYPPLPALRNWEDQPRDELGRWESGGGSEKEPGEGGGSGAGVGGSQGAIPIGTPGSATELSSGQVKEIHDAVAAAEARDPALASGDHALQGVVFSSSAPNDPIFKETGGGGVMAATNTGAVTGNPEALAYGNFHIGVVDTNPAFRELGNPDVTMETAKASEAGAYGTITHELGHAEFAAAGVSNPNTALEALQANGLGSPGDVYKATGSVYGASSPMEALAEYSAQANTPGFSLPSPYAGKYEAMRKSVGL